jgi:uncharacterized membrane protein YoaK (UPF0700 family)
MPYASATPAVRRILQRERTWVALGSANLAAIAGYVNVTLLHFFHVPVSHMSGAASRLSIDLAVLDRPDLLLVLSILGGFLVGAALSGMLIGGTEVRPGRRYGVTLMVEAALLAVAMLLLLDGNLFGVSMAAMACGVQNAMASSYYGLVIRTTHVTGIVTDIGVLLGHWLRHRRVRLWRLGLLTTILVSFVLGGLLGALALPRLGMWSLALPSLGCFLGGLGYFAWQHRRHLARRKLARRRRRA